MAVTYGFYNSVAGDRKYDATQMGAMFDGIVTDGVFSSIGSAFLVAAATGLNITVGIGRAWLQKTWTLNDASLTLTATSSHLTLPRIDEVIIEVNTTTRINSIKILAGTPAASPVRPTLSQTGGLYQYSIASIARPANSSTIVAGNITRTVGGIGVPLAASALLTPTTAVGRLLKTDGDQPINDDTAVTMALDYAVGQIQYNASNGGGLKVLAAGVYDVIGSGHFTGGNGSGWLGTMHVYRWRAGAKTLVLFANTAKLYGEDYNTFVGGKLQLNANDILTVAMSSTNGSGGMTWGGSSGDYRIGTSLSVGRIN